MPVQIAAQLDEPPRVVGREVLLHDFRYRDFVH
jgi:hypothetical protein